MRSKNQIEKELVLGMKRITVPYRRALEILRQHTGKREAGITPNAALAVGDDVCQQLRPSMELISKFEQDVAGLRLEWSALEATPEGELRELIEGHSELLKELIQLLDGVEKAVLQSRNQLTDRVDETQRRNVMSQAYLPRSEHRHA
jgi:hypothetical protein